MESDNDSEFEFVVKQESQEVEKRVEQKILQERNKKLCRPKNLQKIRKMKRPLPQVRMSQLKKLRILT